jgi:hypothetical protein
MFLHPDMSSVAALDHQRTLIEQADHHRLLSAIRRERRGRRSRPSPAHDSRTAATLGGCGRSVAPAR